MIYMFKNLATGEYSEFNHSYVPTGTVIQKNGADWEKVLSPPKYSMAGQWSEQAGTASRHYSHLTGSMVTDAEERQAEADRGLERMTSQDVINQDHALSQRDREEEALLAAHLPTLTDIINS